ncbi:SusC/RagA family TonB-linked outer membrane protein [Mucilaginibacter sp. PAMB04168]|uniref:SusC/RagA family TonB-linked outer membrane protein n=1 Tax=Mucilaginibacter sp. PAMB04168 TaxID=3138567 RepID=UPI0031F6A65F
MRKTLPAFFPSVFTAFSVALFLTGIGASTAYGAGRFAEHNKLVKDGGDTKKVKKRKMVKPIADTPLVLTPALTDTSAYYSALFRRQLKRTSIESVGEVYNADIRKTIAANFGTMITGRLAGLYTQQTSGAPGGDDVSLQLRGRNPVVLIDGTPQSFSSINAEQIESITVLKDALSTAMYGLRSANGLILITTKKGDSRSNTFSFNALQGVTQPVSKPKFLDAYNYATLYNEALTNDGYAAAYSPADLEAFRTGSDPLGHPNVNWQNEVLRNRAAFSSYDLSASGGNKSVRYFADLNYWKQQGFFKTDADRSYNTNADYTRYILRTNVEFDINKYLLASVNLFGRIQDFNEPGATTETILTNLRNTPNSAYPVFNANGSLAGNLNFQNNIYGQVFQSGYRPSNSRDFKFDVALKGNLDPLIKGMWAKALVAMRSYSLEDVNRSRALVVYEPLAGANGTTTYRQYGNIADQVNTATINTQNRLNYTELSLGYDKHTGVHQFNGLLLANNDVRSINSDVSIRYVGLSGNLSYSYNDKYLVQVSAGYNGSNHFAQGNRYGFFPAVGLGWVINKEHFLSDTRWLNNLKLRATYGKTGYDASGYYEYEQYYTSGSNYNLGTTPTTATGLTLANLANPNQTWEKANKLNIGIDAAILNNAVTFSAEYFNNKYYDLLITRGGSSNLFGITYPDENLGQNRYSGFEFQAAYQKQSKYFGFYVSPNLTIQRSKVLFQDEVTYPYSYMQRTGQTVGQIYGYLADGLFQTQAEANAAAKPFSTARAGDIKYRDINSDGVINSYDQTVIGNKGPLIYYGLNLGVNWKGVDISALLQGVSNRSLIVGNTGVAGLPQGLPTSSYLIPANQVWEFQTNGRGQAYESNLNRWTPATAATATYPRASVGTNLNNSQLSSFWVRSGNYMRLKSVELGYTLPLQLTGKIGLKQARIYINGYNLFTATKLKDVDPEGFSGLYPVQKMFNAGINVKF